MKKQLFAAVFSAVVLFSGTVPVVAQEYVVGVPQGATAVEAKEMKKFRKWDGKSCDPMTVGKKRSCPEFVRTYANHVLLNVSELGALYRFNALHVQRSWEGLAWKMQLEHYLPDGFYKAGKQYYWVADGERMNLGTKKNLKKAHTSFVKRLHKDAAAGWEFSDEEYLNLHGEALCLYSHGTISEECVPPTNEEIGRLLREYEGKVVVRNNADGEITSVDPYGFAPYTLTSKSQFAKNVPMIAITNVSMRTVTNVPQYRSKKITYMRNDTAFKLKKNQTAEHTATGMYVTLNNIDDDGFVQITVQDVSGAETMLNLSLKKNRPSLYELGDDGENNYQLELLHVNKKATLILHVTE